jgi:rfaE bifunctional protein kinase chain/domain
MKCPIRRLDGEHAEAELGREPPPEVNNNDALPSHNRDDLGAKPAKQHLDHPPRHTKPPEGLHPSNPESEVVVPETHLADLHPDSASHPFPGDVGSQRYSVAATTETKPVDRTNGRQPAGEMPFKTADTDDHMGSIPPDKRIGDFTRVHRAEYSWPPLLRHQSWVTLRTVDQRRRLLEIIDAFHRARLVLYGDLVLDRFILGTPKRISREAPIIILRHEGQRDIPGGGANALANLAALDTQVVPVSVVGDDEPGDTLIRALNDRGVETSRVVRVAGFRTPTKVRVLGGGSSSLKHQVARYDIEDTLPATGSWRQDTTRSLIAAARDAGAVAVSDYGYGTVFPEGLQALREHRRAGAWVCADSRYRIAELPGIDAATPNLEELEAVAGRELPRDEDVVDAAQDLLRRRGAQFVLATRGNRGMTLVQAGHQPCHIAVFGTDEVADVTGAGDTVLAVLTAALATGADPEDAARLANYAGGIVVMKVGTAVVSRAELRRAVCLDLPGTSS